MRRASVRRRWPRTLTGNRPPSPAEFEVSLLGPGYGESVVVHLGDQRWMIVDSCIDRQSREPAALRYLSSIGVPFDNVLVVVATHWDDDHIRGLADVVRACSNAQFVYSDGLRGPDFLTLVDAISGDPNLASPSGVSEFAGILKVLQERYGLRGIRPVKAIEGRPLWVSSSGISARVVALSPSDRAAALATLDIARLLPKSGKKRVKVAAAPPNHVSVALHVTVGDVVAILGADLDEVGNPTLGWAAVIASPTVPKAQAHLFKVPHHGSETGYHEPAWRKLLLPNVVAPLTPFIKGNVRVPSPEEAAQIMAHTSRAFSTAQVAARPRYRHTGVVARTLKEAVRKTWATNPKLGHVRFRVSTSGQDPGTVELLDGAVRLDAAHS